MWVIPSLLEANELFDVAVICPLAASHLLSSEPCESYAKTQKTDRYAAAFEKSDYDFAPVVFETSGVVNKEGESVLKQIIRFASKREGITTLFLLLEPGLVSLVVFNTLPLSRF